MEQIRLLRQSRLKVLLPDDVGAALMDGVVLCHLANHIRPRSVASIHVPSPAVPKLSMAKCRRNVENFLDACKKLGVPQVGSSVSSLYKSTHFILRGNTCFYSTTGNADSPLSMLDTSVSYHLYLLLICLMFTLLLDQ
uniref:Calponin-homology (CH) domain-containing protein n=1 Tax=Sinocyclocheilus anshuiensis TaxID=1608454 RepID=A0A671KP77_9TELE